MSRTRLAVVEARRWIAFAVAIIGWLLVAIDPEVLDRSGDVAVAIGPGAAAWRTLAVGAVIAAAVSILRPTVTSIATAGAVPVAIGLWRGVLYIDLDAVSPLGVWLLVTAVSIDVTFNRLEKLP